MKFGISGPGEVLWDSAFSSCAQNLEVDRTCQIAITGERWIIHVYLPVGWYAYILHYILLTVRRIVDFFSFMIQFSRKERYACALCSMYWEIWCKASSKMCTATLKYYSSFGGSPLSFHYLPFIINQVGYELFQNYVVLKNIYMIHLSQLDCHWYSLTCTQVHTLSKYVTLLPNH